MLNYSQRSSTTQRDTGSPHPLSFVTPEPTKKKGPAFLFPCISWAFLTPPRLPMKKAQKELFNTLQNEDQSRLSSFVSLSAKRSGDLDLAHIVGAIPAHQHEEFGDLIEAHLKTVTTLLQRKELNPEDPETQIPPSNTTLNTIKAFATLLHHYAEQEKFVAPKSIYDSICLLHDSIFSLGDSTQAYKTQSKIVELCVLWYHQERDGRDYLVPLSITFLFGKTLSEDGKSADLKKLYQMRKALTLLDLEESVSIRQLIQQASIHPLFILNEIGKKLIAYFFRLHLNLVDEIHQAIMSNLVGAKQWVIDSYAVIYLKAWKDAEGPFKISIERSCIQDYISHAIHIKDKALQKACTSILMHFHQQKVHLKHIDAMLVPLYEPILWRALQVANPFVRRNAVEQFACAFPLISDEWPAEKVDEALQKQFEMVQQLHSDPVPTVRIEAIHLTGHILSSYFEFVPYRVSQVFLSTLIQSLSKDKSSAEVRRAVIKSVITILKVPATHTMIKGLLPHLKHLIHDTSKAVRSLMVQLLIVIQGIKEIKYYDVVPLKDLLARLAIDPKLVPSLMDLLVPSYFPYGRKKPTHQLLKRCMIMIRENPQAARVFYANLASRVPPSAVVSFIISLWKKCLYKWIQNKQLAKEMGEDYDEAIFEEMYSRFDEKYFHRNICETFSHRIMERSDRLREEKKKDKRYLKLGDEKVAALVFEVMAALWKNLDLSAGEDQPLVGFLANNFDDNAFIAMQDFLIKSINDESMDIESATNIQRSIFEMAGCISSSSLPSFVRSAIEYLTPDTHPQIQIALLTALFGWDYRDRTIKMASDWISGLKEDFDEETDDLEEVTFGLKLFNMVISEPTLRTSVISHQEVLNTMIEPVAPYMNRISDRLFGELNSRNLNQVLLAAMDLYYRLLVHVAGEIRSPDFSAFKDLLEWCLKYPIALLQQMGEKSELDEDNPTDTQEFAQEVCHIAFLICSEVNVVGLGTPELAHQQLTLIQSLLPLPLSLKTKENYIKIALKVIYHLYHSGRDRAIEVDLPEKCGDFFGFLRKTFPFDFLQNVTKWSEFSSLATQRPSIRPFIEKITSPVVHEEEEE